MKRNELRRADKPKQKEGDKAVSINIITLTVCPREENNFANRVSRLNRQKCIGTTTTLNNEIIKICCEENKTKIAVVWFFARTFRKVS